jgi:Fusaric acid resistance protein-like
MRSVLDWLSVRDPGWGKAQLGWRTLVGLVAGLATGYFVAVGFGLPGLLGLTFGGLLGLLPGLLVANARVGELAVSLAWYVPPFAVAQLLGLWLAPYKAAGLALIVMMAFLQAYLPRFGHSGNSFGIALFAFYIVGLQAPVPLRLYPRFLVVAVAAVAAVFVARAVLCWYRPVWDLRWTQRAFLAACRRAAASAAGVLAGGDRASRRLERDLGRVNTVALVFDGRLGRDGVDGRFAEYLHRSVFDVEDALLSLADVVVALGAERVPEAGAAAADQLRALAAGRTADSGPLLAAAAALAASGRGGRACELLGQAADEVGRYQRSVASLTGETELAVEDQVTFRGIVALEGGVKPAGAGPLARWAAAAAPRWWGLVPRPEPLAASAIQTAVATAVVLPISYALDPQRYYWGVIGVAIIGAGVATSHERGRKLLRRGAGTVVGAAAGLGLHHLIGSGQADPWGTLAVIVAAMTVGAYFISVNYAAFVACLVIALAQVYAYAAPGGLDTLLAYRLAENLLGAAVGLIVALLVLPVPIGSVFRAGLHGYLQALRGFTADLGAHLADPGAGVRLRADSRALDHALFQTRLVVGHLVPRSGRHRRGDALLDRLSGGARQVRTIVGHVPPSPGTAATVTTVTPLIETLATTIAALDRRISADALPEPASPGRHAHSPGRHVHRQRSRLTADDPDLTRILTALHDLDQCLISIGATNPNLTARTGHGRGSGVVSVQRDGYRDEVSRTATHRVVTLTAHSRRSGSLELRYRFVDVKVGEIPCLCIRQSGR